MTATTLFWHDYETFGIDPRRDRPAQFAGVRTDLEFNIVAEPVKLYCQPPEDYLPHPEACAITGITPQYALAHGVCEAEFAVVLQQHLAEPNTCALGYNSLRFDDEVTRNILYRNFYEPYAREWQNGNSRWDLIDVIRAAYALRPDGIVWPTDAEGKVSLKLEALTKANGLSHEAAHDALSDVYATIALAKLLKNAQPKLYQFLWEHRVKTEVVKLLQVGAFKPLVHISGKYPAARHCMAVVLPLMPHPTDTNVVLVYDLSIDPEPLLSLSAEKVSARLFTASADLPPGVARIPLKGVHINRCPVLAPLSVLREADAERLALNLTACLANAERLKSAANLKEKLNAIYTAPREWQVNADPELGLYSGGFLGSHDKNLFQKIHTLSPAALAEERFSFKDSRFSEMLFRYRARNYPSTLSAAEQQQWRKFCSERLNQRGDGYLNFTDYFKALDNLPHKPSDALLAELIAFGKTKQQAWALEN